MPSSRQLLAFMRGWGKGRTRDDRQRLRDKSFAFQKTCRCLGLKHIRAKPYTPKTNGKARAVYPNKRARVGLCPRLH